MTSERGFYISDYKTLLIGINFLVTGILGILWLIYAIKYFKGIKNDKKLIYDLEDKYQKDILMSPTCSNDGKQKYVCSVCLEYYFEVLPATGKHDVTVDVQNPTCVADGITISKCKKCKEI